MWNRISAALPRNRHVGQVYPCFFLLARGASVERELVKRLESPTRIQNEINEKSRNSIGKPRFNFPPRLFCFPLKRFKGNFIRLSNRGGWRGGLSGGLSLLQRKSCLRPSLNFMPCFAASFCPRCFNQRRVSKLNESPTRIQKVKTRRNSLGNPGSNLR